MTKAEKKEKVFHLVEHFKKSINDVELKSLKNKIIKEVSECPFSEEAKTLFDLSLMSWNVDIDYYINEAKHHRIDQEVHNLATTCVVGIYNFIDLSLLED